MLMWRLYWFWKINWESDFSFAKLWKKNTICTISFLKTQKNSLKKSFRCWIFLCGMCLNYKLNFLNTYQPFQIFYFFLSQFCMFQGYIPPKFSKCIGHEIVQNIILTSIIYTLMAFFVFVLGISIVTFLFLDQSHLIYVYILLDFSESQLQTVFIFYCFCLIFSWCMLLPCSSFSFCYLKFAT